MTLRAGGKMKLLFIDETSDDKFKDYFGLCMSLIDHTHYAILKEKFHKILNKSKWNVDIEFKGQFIFSAKSGDISVPINERIEICKQIVDLTASKRNSRVKFYYTSKRGITNQKEEYLRSIPLLLSKALPKAPTGAGKNIIAMNFDSRRDVNYKEIREVAYPIIKEKGYILFEDIVLRESCYETIGILYTDIVAYLIARVETIGNDSELFASIPPEEFENNGKIKKLKNSTELIQRVKSFKIKKI
jgi:hypothetical protein